MKKTFFFLFVIFFGIKMNSQIVYIPDAYFKATLIDYGIDTDMDGNIQLSEAAVVTSLSVSSSNVHDITGIQSFINLGYFSATNSSILNANFSGMTNLIKIDLDFSSSLSYVNVSGCTSLEELELFECDLNQLIVNSTPNLRTLSCAENNLTNLNVSNCTNLENLVCASNFLTNLNLNNLTSLETLNCRLNNLTTIDLSSSTLLRELDCSMNQLSQLSINNNTQLESLICFANNLTSLDLSNFSSLIELLCKNNQLTTLNLTSCSSLIRLSCEYNNLNSLFMKNGSYEGDYNIPYTFLVFEANPNLEYICCDENEAYLVQLKVNSYGYSNCNVVSYCTFVPGGIYYTLEGTQKLDLGSNGCDSFDTIFPNMKYTITNGTQSSTIISNETGDYFIPLQAGIHNLIPIIENPTYFNLTPTNLIVDFPLQVSPFIQNFCVTPNGVHSDLEISLTPLVPSRPGFDASYKVVYKNKGNTTLSGAVTFEFEDDKMDVISSIPNFSAQATGILTYDYLNLQPFETREILITININSPQETPSVNIGDQLDFTAIINPLAGDEYLLDNASSLKQIVVGSYDPNDKTCIEGNSVGSEMIGQYVHYVIRFENTGTFPAENVVVKDMIDLTKFDLSSLIPTSSSHSFVTRIAAGGKVEFIFENIQLPFDDANNDGYIAFKIKTLPSLAVGDTFSNSANIYFDYNFPIVTNTTSTTIQVLGNSDFNFGEFLTIYPNPTQNSLNITMNNEISISSINIYNSLGQLVLVTTNPSESIDVSNLKTGSYFVKVISDKGISTTQFIKE